MAVSETDICFFLMCGVEVIFISGFWYLLRVKIMGDGTRTFQEYDMK